MERPPCFARIGWALNQAHHASRSPGADGHDEMSKLESWHFDCEQMSSSGLEGGDSSGPSRVSWPFGPSSEQDLFRFLSYIQANEN